MPVSKKALLERNRTIKALRKLHPEAWTELNYKTPFELLVAVILSAQATDKIVNIVTRDLFKKYRKPSDFASVTLAKLDKDIARINFHTNKARSIQGAVRMIISEFGGKVPQTMAELVRLPGVGRKTANVVLGHAFNRSEGFVVDTHVARLANRFGWTNNTDPAKIEVDLMKLFPKSQWREIGDLLVLHGRYVCKAGRPK